jgi:hypothetical protein
MATVGSASSDAFGGGIAGGTEAGSGTIAQYENGYIYKNYGATSGIVQSGYQAGVYTTENDVNSYGILGGSIANSQVDAQQSGATMAGNNGNGTYMAGAGAAEGSVKVTASANSGGWVNYGGADSAASAEQVQQHTYSQAAFNPTTGQSQWATGTVGTYNQASVSVSD